MLLVNNQLKLEGLNLPPETLVVSPEESMMHNWRKQKNQFKRGVIKLMMREKRRERRNRKELVRNQLLSD
jgi:hypothetical protein